MCPLQAFLSVPLLSYSERGEGLIVMRIALPIWEDKISPVLDTASRLLVLTEKGGGKSDRFEVSLDGMDLHSRCFRIQALEVQILICGAVSSLFSRMLSGLGVQVISGISGGAEDVLYAYHHEGLSNPRFLMPGYKRRDSS
jgi:hypothetical protein